MTNVWVLPSDIKLKQIGREMVRLIQKYYEGDNTVAEWKFSRGMSDETRKAWQRSFYPWEKSTYNNMKGEKDMKDIIIRKVFGGGYTLQIGCTITGAYGPGQEGMLTDHILAYMRNPKGREKKFHEWEHPAPEAAAHSDELKEVSEEEAPGRLR